MSILVTRLLLVDDQLLYALGGGTNDLYVIPV